MYLLFFVLGLGVGLGIWWVVRRREGNLSPAFPSKGEGETVINPAQVAKHKENLELIISYLGEHAQITNNDAEKLLDVSNATAERYLNELEGQGKIVQVGRTGQGVYYKLKNRS